MTARSVAKRIQHLARYFMALGVFCVFAYLLTKFSIFLLFLGPPFFIIYWLRLYANFLIGWIPHTPFFNNFFLLLPVTVVYFGFAGFQIKNLINEKGKFSWVVLAVFLLFLFYVHVAAVKELSLYGANLVKT